MLAHPHPQVTVATLDGGHPPPGADRCAPSAAVPAAAGGRAQLESDERTR